MLHKTKLLTARFKINIPKVAESDGAKVYFQIKESYRISIEAHLQNDSNASGINKLMKIIRALRYLMLNEQIIA